MTQAAAGALDIQRGVQQEPLNEQELKLLHRLLSDPSLLPREFKQWVTDHSSDTVDITKSQVHGLISSQGSIIFTAASWEQLGAALCPMIVPYPATVAPKNWILCDGRFLAESEYPQLFSFLGHQHDPFGNTGFFAIPDLRGRAIYGYDAQSGTGYIPFASHDSSALGARGPSHRHYTLPHSHAHNHNHGLGTANWGTTGGNAGVVVGGGSSTTTSAPNFPQTGDSDYLYTSDSNPQATPAYYALNYIIASGQVPH